MLNKFLVFLFVLVEHFHFLVYSYCFFNFLRIIITDAHCHKAGIKCDGYF